MIIGENKAWHHIKSNWAKEKSERTNSAPWNPKSICIKRLSPKIERIYYISNVPRKSPVNQSVVSLYVIACSVTKAMWLYARNLLCYTQKIKRVTQKYKYTQEKGK